MIQPFRYPRSISENVLHEVAAIKDRIENEVVKAGELDRNVKLGRGGIREIEFVIQALQLIYAGRDKSLREKNALKALHMLSQKGLITYQEHAALAKAYVFLRMVEHRIQILDDLQTQTMPSGDREMRSLARRAGYLEHGREAESLFNDYRAQWSSQASKGRLVRRARHCARAILYRIGFLEVRYPQDGLYEVRDVMRHPDHWKSVRTDDAVRWAVRSAFFNGLKSHRA